MAFDKRTAQFWKNLAPGSFVTLSDNETISESIESTGNLNGLQYEVVRVIEVTESRDLLTWRFFVLESQGEVLWLCAKIVDKDFDLRVYIQPDDFSPGDRQDQLDWDNQWLFQEPDDVDNIDLESLLYTTTIVRSEDDSKVTYVQKGQGELNGRVVETPLPSGQSPDLLATVSEYNTEDHCHSPEAMILEIGDPQCETGGLIKFLVGYPIQVSEIDAIPV